MKWNKHIILLIWTFLASYEVHFRNWATGMSNEHSKMIDWQRDKRETFIAVRSDSDNKNGGQGNILNKVKG